MQCDRSNGGCGGGWPTKAFDYLRSKSLNLEQYYPYTSGNGVTGSCRTDLERGYAYVTSYANVPQNNPSQLMAYVNRGVVSIIIQANQPVFGQYRSGIINSSQCGTQLDHAVAVVGYGANYFIVRNSWGAGWGEGGYVRLAIENGVGPCGMNMMPSQPYTS